MRWEEFEHLEPKLGALGRAKLGGPGVVLVGTVRSDGSPRISPVEPLFWRRDLWLSMGWQTQKTRDLHRDPRILVHSIVTSREGTGGEYKVRGRAIAELDSRVHEAYAEVVAVQLGWRPEAGRFHLFRVDTAEVTYIRWDGATNDQYVTRWPAGVEFVRRGTSATSLSGPAPFHELLAQGGD